MNSQSKYKTKQREILLNYFKTVSGDHITAGNVCEHFKKQGMPIGKATVYRQLNNLVDEGIIKKYIIDSGSPACFEYVGSDSDQEINIGFHCKCEKCGKIIHMHCDEFEHIQAHLYKEHSFKLNPMRTVFYGLCEKCV